MRTKEEIIKDTTFSEYDWKRNELSLEVQIDIRDQLTRIADYLESQTITTGNSGEVPDIPGFEETMEALDKLKIR